MLNSKNLALLLLFFFFLFLIPYLNPQENYCLSIYAQDYSKYSRIFIQSPFSFDSTLHKQSSFLLVKIKSDQSYSVKKEPVHCKLIKSVGWSKGNDSCIITIQTSNPDFSYDYFSLPNPPRLVIDIYREENKNSKNISYKPPPFSSSSNSSNSTPSSNSSQTPAQKTIVIDPGHGGLETGARGEYGTLEKDITLDISLKLRDILQRNLACRVVLTREEDVDISLDRRAAIANNNDAFLFVSIHANSSFCPHARGSEVYFLSLEATDEEARRLAYLENNSTRLDTKIEGENEGDIKMILWDMAQAAYLRESSTLAESVQKELNVFLDTSNRGIKQAPFKVLTGVACPAVLVEVAFLSNPKEEKKLREEEFQKKVVEAIYRGLKNYLRKIPQKKR